MEDDVHKNAVVVFFFLCELKIPFSILQLLWSASHFAGLARLDRAIED